MEKYCCNCCLGVTVEQTTRARLTLSWLKKREQDARARESSAQVSRVLNWRSHRGSRTLLCLIVINIITKEVKLKSNSSNCSNWWRSITAGLLQTLTTTHYDRIQCIALATRAMSMRGLDNLPIYIIRTRALVNTRVYSGRQRLVICARMTIDWLYIRAAPKVRVARYHQPNSTREASDQAYSYYSVYFGHSQTRAHDKLTRVRVIVFFGR